MDVNGTRFQLVLGRDDWARCTDGAGVGLGLAWDENGRTDIAEVEWAGAANELTLRSLTPEVVSAPADRPPSRDDRRGAARDRFGNWYWVDASRTELRVGQSRGPSSHFWAAADAAPDAGEPRRGDFAFVAPPTVPPVTFGGLAVTTDHYLVAGVLRPGGLAVFDLLAGGGPVQWLWAGDVDFTPVDLAARADGGVVVLDRAAHHARCWTLDRRLLVQPRRRAHGPRDVSDFAPAEGGLPGSGRTPTAPLVAADAVPLHGDPIAIEAAADGSVLVLDGTAISVQRFLDGTAAGAPTPLRHTGVHDFALVSAPGSGPRAIGRLYTMDHSGNQVFEHALAVRGGFLQAQLDRAYYPIRGFAGKGIVAAGDSVYYDRPDTWLPVVEQRRRRYVPSGAVVTHPLDGKEPACVWHRLLMDACLPPAATLRVSTRTSDDLDGLRTAEWRAEPVPLPRSDGSELPFLAAQPDGHSTWELLFQAAVGRYLQVRLELGGDGRSSPRIRALRAYYPRYSYLERFLPGVYREDETSASFLERFLANPEGILTALEGRMAATQVLFDPRTTPKDALDWLAGWFDVALDPAWAEDRRRLFVAHAMDFFRLRGTVRGVELALRLALDECVDESLFDADRAPRGVRQVTIVEWFRRRTGGATELNEATDAAGLRTSDRLGLTWRPAVGAPSLHASFVKFVDPRGTQPPGSIVYPIRRPADAQAASAWETFSRDALGFVPSASTADVSVWRDFLARRYRRPGALAQAYGEPGGLSDWDSLRLPSTLPQGIRALGDWFHFERVILPFRALAHRFTVLLPVRPPEHPDDREAVARNQTLAELARRIVELEKPAHTVFDVRFFWAVFRLGDARLGHDTIAELGTRGLALRPAVLGREHLGESVLSSGLPADLAARAAGGLVSNSWRSPT